MPPAHNTAIQVTDSTLLVDWNKADEQTSADRITAAREAAIRATEEGAENVGPVDVVLIDAPADHEPHESSNDVAVPRRPNRYFGSVKVDPDRYSRDIGNVTREIIDRLAGAGAKLEITIDIQASKSNGFDEGEVRTISENARVLKFDPSSGFESA